MLGDKMFWVKKVPLEIVVVTDIVCIPKLQKPADVIDDFRYLQGLVHCGGNL